MGSFFSFFMSQGPDEQPYDEETEMTGFLSSQDIENLKTTWPIIIGTNTGYHGTNILVK